MTPDRSYSPLRHNSCVGGGRGFDQNLAQLIMELYAAGFNAWNQLCFQGSPPPPSGDEEPDDLHTFSCVLVDDGVLGDITPSLSYTLVETSSGTRAVGEVPEEDAALKRRHGSCAQAANGSIAVLVDARTVCQYGSIPDALAATGTGNNTSIKPKLHQFSDDVVQLVAYDVGFAALSAAGSVWTWGDDRYPGCLARPVTDNQSAQTAGLVTDLEDLPTGKIKRIAAGGYLLAALTTGGDLYCWGGHPGRKAIIDDSSEDMLSGPVPIVVDEDADVADVAVGESHLIVLTDRGGVFVIGENTNGQLGLGRDGPASARSWTRVELPRPLAQAREIVGVAAGSRCSFIKTKSK
ncbi:hypothetical protein RB595_004707 [Gaeumannomyces hyphopodioides]